MRIKLSNVIIGVAGLGGLIYLIKLARAETAPPKKYKCTGAPNYQCVEDPSGPYDSLVMCQAACVAPVLTSILASPSSSTINVGATKQLAAICKDQHENTMTCPTLTWTSSNTGVATVSSAGLVTGVGAGTVTITVTSGTISGTASVTVNTETPILTTISLSPSSAIINVGATRQLTATCLDQFGNQMTCPTLTWTSSDSTKATVSSTGLVAGVVAGNTIITARSGTISGTSSITVTAVTPVLTSISIPTPISVTVGGTADITAICKDQNGSIMTCPGTLSWNIVDGGSFITVTSTGVNTARAAGVAAGTAHITASY